MEDDSVNGIVFISFANFGEEPYKPLVEALQGRCTKPVFFALLGTRKDFQIAQAYLETSGFPCYEIPEMAVRVFSRMWRYARRRTETT
jgi:acyl-CoA synthetase (NDP forming)